MRRIVFKKTLESIKNQTSQSSDFHGLKKKAEKMSISMGDTAYLERLF